ncbi:MAG: polyphenol oxidase family protein, partial [Gemmatimonadota bacterium]|nr:polyphenol oxidase family protein [Gemmatimonadota bacterium]
AGITRAGAGTFSVSAGSGDELLEVYSGLAEQSGFRAIAVPRQVHGADVETIYRDGASGEGATRVLLAGRVDGLVTGDAGVLLASTAADCVPVYLCDPEARAVGLVHAGWRGVVSGILERGLEALAGVGAETQRVRVHLGPAICGACYEVDARVLRHFGSSSEKAQLDLRGALIQQAMVAGARARNVTVSTHCTSCGDADLHSHRASGGKAGRMAAFTGFRRTE